MDIIDKLKRKIFLLAGRAILSSIDNTAKTATVQGILLSGETITGIEYFSPYGFEAMPSEGQAVGIFINGNRDQGIILALHDRETRPKDLELDESQLWSKFNNYVKCNKDEEVEINGKIDYAVRYLELEKAFNQLKSDFDTFIADVFNKHMHPTAAAGSPSAPTLAGSPSGADITPAKVETVRLP